MIPFFNLKETAQTSRLFLLMAFSILELNLKEKGQ